MKRFFVVIIMCLLLLPHQSLAVEVQRGETGQGQGYWLVQDDFTPVMSMTITFLDGSAGDAVDHQGLSLIVARLMTEGAGEYDAQSFRARMRDLAMSISASASRDAMTVTLQTPKRAMNEAAELLRLALYEACFDEADIDRVRAEQLSRLRNSLKDPDWIASRIMLSQIYGSDHPYALNSGGTLSSLRSISRGDIVRRYQQVVTDSKTHIAIVGDIGLEDAAAWIDQVMGPAGAFDRSVPAPVFPEGKRFTHAHDGPQTSLRLIWPAPAKGDDDYAASIVLAHILGGGFGSRLMEELREERGLTYGVSARVMSMRAAGRLIVSGATSHNNVGAFLGETRRIIHDILTQGISQEELEKAKSYMIGSHALGLTSTGRISSALAGLQLYQLPPTHLDDWLEDVAAVTMGDMNVVIQAILGVSPVTIAVGDTQDGDEWQEIKDVPNVE